MRLMLSALFILCFLTAAGAVDEDTISAIYEKEQGGVVYIEQAIYLDSKLVKSSELFEKIENVYDIKLVDRYLPLGNGTGFMIGANGYIITNYHVINNEESEKFKASLLERIDKNFISKISEDVISENESNRVFLDFRKMINSAQPMFRVIVGNQYEYIADVVKSDPVLDLALLKIYGENFEILPLNDNATVKVGNGVVAIGYPNMSISFEKNKVFVSTMTTGYISCLKNEVWGIQHTSPINPGNSGGPLLNMKGEVVGINVGINSQANSVNFSIPVNILLEWLKQNDMYFIVTDNKKEHKAHDSRVYCDSKEVLEVGKEIFIDLDPGFAISLNGKFMGVTPKLIKELSAGENIIRIESDTKYIEKKIIVVSDIDEIVTFNPTLKDYKGKLYITTEPVRASIYIDGNIVGYSPVVLNDISAGGHDLEIRADNYAVLTDKLTVVKDKLTEIEYKLKTGYRLVFSDKLPEDAVIEVKKDGFLNKFKVKDSFWLENGKWEVSIFSNNLPRLAMEVVIDNKDEFVELKSGFVDSKIILHNLKRDSKIYMDGKEIKLRGRNNSFDANLGQHRLIIVTENYRPIILGIDVKKMKDENVYLKYKVEFSGQKDKNNSLK
jgi:hypothetical protein